MKVLKQRIEVHLPAIIKSVDDKKEQVMLRLEQLGAPIPEDSLEQQRLVFHYIKQYTEGIQSIIDGNFEKLPESFQDRLLQEEAFGAAQIRKIFEITFVGSVDKIDIKSLPKDRIQKVLINTMGNNLPDFLPFSGFRNLISPYMQKVNPVALKCLDDVHQYVQSIAKELCKAIFGNFPFFLEKVSFITATVFSQLKENTKVQVEKVMKTTSYIFTVNSEYTTNSNKPNENAAIPQTRGSAEEMKQKLTAYYDGVFKPCIKDLIPQTIGTCLLQEVNNALELAFLEILSDRDIHKDLLQEPPERKSEREALNKENDTLTKASNLLSQFSWR